MEKWARINGEEGRVRRVRRVRRVKSER